MNLLSGFLSGTPLWVYLLFIYLMLRGIRARKPGEVTPGKLAIVPLIFTLMGLVEMQRLYGFRLESVSLWLLSLIAGMAIGVRFVKLKALTVDRRRGIINRPADLTVLPVMLMAFVSKYAFGVLQATDSGLVTRPWVMASEIITYGLFAGIFVGKFSRYLQAYRAAPGHKAG